MGEFQKVLWRGLGKGDTPFLCTQRTQMVRLLGRGINESTVNLMPHGGGVIPVLEE